MREMKNSGIEWIGDIPISWDMGRTKHHFKNHKFVVGEKADKFERLALTLSGVIKRSKDDSTGLQPEAFEGYQIVYSNELIFKLIDLENVSTSRVGLSPYTGIVSPAYIILKCTDDYSPRYAEYFFLSMWQREVFNHMGDNGVRSSLNASDLLNVPYPSLPLAEQQRIADFLDQKCGEIDAVIAKTRATIEEYKKLKQSIITEVVTKGIRGERPMKDSGIKWVKMIPQDWEPINPKVLFSQRRDKAIPGERQLTASQQLGIIYQDDYMQITGSKVVTVEKDFDILKHVEAGDFVISMRSFQGGLEYSENTGSISSAYVMLIPNLNLVFPHFFKWLLKSSAYINALQSTSNMVRDGQAMRYSNFAQVRLYTVPLDEQKEIADYLDQKCAEMDALIAQKTAFLEELELYKRSVIYEYVTGKKSCDAAEQSVVTAVIYPYFPAALSTNKPRFAQAVLMSRILDKCRKKMGRVKLEKMLYTIESSIGFDFDTEYAREAAGPLDGSIYECEGIVSRRNKWFTVHTSRYGVSYKPAKDSGKYKKYYDKYFADHDSEIERIIGVFVDYDADQAEIVATLFAAWNDFIIDRKPVTDEALADEVLNNWNDSKKRFSRDVWLCAIQQMRQNNIVPKGYGKHTVLKN